MEKMYNTKWIYLYLAIGFAFFYACKWLFPELWAFAGGLLAAVLAVYGFILFTEFVNGTVDTFNEIVNKKNQAYGKFLVALAIVYSSAFMVTFFVFFKD